MFTETSLVRRKLRAETTMKTVFGLMALTMVVPLIAIVIHIFVEAWPVLDWNFFTDYPRNQMKEGGIFPALYGTFLMVALSLVIAAPVGVLAGIYLNEYAGDNWFTRIVNLAVVNLAGVPSIVHALFGLGAFVYLIGRPCVLAASMTLAIMTVPVIIASTKQALAAVPMAFREACWNVGATRWQTIRTIVLPNSVSGILTGFILEVSRAAGETAPILFTGAVIFRRELPRNLTEDQCMALPYHLYTIATQGARVPETMQYATAVALLALIVVVNLAAIVLRVYFRNRKKW